MLHAKKMRFGTTHLTCCCQGAYSRRCCGTVRAPHASCKEQPESVLRVKCGNHLLNPVTLAAATTAMCSGGGSSAGGAQVASASAHCSRSADGQMMSSGQSSG